MCTLSGGQWADYGVMHSARSAMDKYLRCTGTCARLSTRHSTREARAIRDYADAVNRDGTQARCGGMVREGGVERPVWIQGGAVYEIEGTRRGARPRGVRADAGNRWAGCSRRLSLIARSATRETGSDDVAGLFSRSVYITNT